MGRDYPYFYRYVWRKKIGIVMYWTSKGVGDCDFTAFPNDTTLLSNVTPDVIMKFKPEVIHYIIA